MEAAVRSESFRGACWGGILVLAAGIYLPAPLVAWFQNVARLLG